MRLVPPAVRSTGIAHAPVSATRTRRARLSLLTAGGAAPRQRFYAPLNARMWRLSSWFSATDRPTWAPEKCGSVRHQSMPISWALSIEHTMRRMRMVRSLDLGQGDADVPGDEEALVENAIQDVHEPGGGAVLIERHVRSHAGLPWTARARATSANRTSGEYTMGLAYEKRRVRPLCCEGIGPQRAAFGRDSAPKSWRARGDSCYRPDWSRRTGWVLRASRAGGRRAGAGRRPSRRPRQVAARRGQRLRGRVRTRPPRAPDERQLEGHVRDDHDAEADGGRRDPAHEQGAMRRRSAPPCAPAASHPQTGAAAGARLREGRLHQVGHRRFRVGGHRHWRRRPRARRRGRRSTARRTA